MAGPYQPHQGTDPYPSQPLPYPETSGALSPAPSYPGTSYPGTSYPGTSYPGTSYPATSYPGTLPPPLPYPKRRRGRTIAAVLVSLAVVAGIVVAAVFAGARQRDQPTGTADPRRLEGGDSELPGRPVRR